MGTTHLSLLALGYINDGFNGTHTIQIFDVATRQAVTGALATVITVGGGATSNSFTYSYLAAPVTLMANTQYQIVSQFFVGEHYFTNAKGLSSAPGITLGDAVYDNYGAPPAVPTFANGSFAGNDPGDFGPNFLVNVATTPEPSSLVLLGTGGLAMAAAGRRKYRDKFRPSL